MSAGPLLLALAAAALKAGLLVALAAVLAATLGRAPARARHGVWAGALLGALLLPLLAPWVPDWSIAALPVPALAGERAGPPAVPQLPEARPRAARPAGAVAGLDSTSRPPATAGTMRTNPPAPRLPRLSAAAWLLLLWAVGALVSFAGFLRALGAARRLERRAAAPDSSWLEELAVARRWVGLRRPVRLLVGAEAATPMTWGLLRPVVLLPARAASWSRERRRMVLLHELVHIRRADWLVRLAARVVCSLYWLNPIVWLAARRLAVEQEIACDEEVVALGARPSSYARHLLAIARAAGPAGRVPAHALDMARRSQMEGRLMSILDGGRRLRGGRKLAILALLLIAGLVPALAAIEPWVAEEESVALSQTGGSTEPVTDPRTEEVARVVGEIEELEEEMEPFEAELEALEEEMEPIQRELEQIQLEMEAVEVEVEGVTAEVEPFQETLEAVEMELEPHRQRLEAIEVEMEPFREELEAIDVELEPLRERLEAIEVELEPFREQLEGIEVELEPLQMEMEELSEAMEPLAADGSGSPEEMERLGARMREVGERMAPFHERMGAIHEQMEPLHERLAGAIRETEPLHERMAAVHERLEPLYERMAAVHQEMEPLHERMGAIHQEMEPVYRRMGEAHERMSPYHERMGAQHERMEPYHRKMGEVHERMQPLYEEMGRRHTELRRELETVVERVLATELESVTAAGTDFSPAARRILDEVSLRIDDGTLRILSSAPELRRVLEDSLGAASVVPEPQFAAAAERCVRALSELEVAAR